MSGKSQFLGSPLVLRNEGAAQELLEMAHTLGWTFVRDNSALPASQHVQETIWSPADHVYVHLITDMATRSRSLTLSTSSTSAATRAADVLHFLRERVSSFTLDELTAQVAQADSDGSLAVSVVRLGMGAPNEFNESVFALLRDAMEHPTAGVRNAAVWASRYVLWAELVPLITRMRDGDAEPLLRSVATDVLALYREAGVVS